MLKSNWFIKFLYYLFYPFVFWVKKRNKDKIREVSKKDLDKILKLYNLNFSKWTKKELLSLFENGAKCFIYKKGQFIAGFIIFKCVFNECEIISVAVSNKYRKQKIGSKLLSFMFNYLGKHHYVFLEVRRSNVAAQKLYEKFGFEQINIRKNYYNNPIEDALIYKKVL